MTNTKDPIAGLVNFVQEIKPFHTKVVHVSVEYIYEETTNVSVADSIESHTEIHMDLPVQADQLGFDSEPWGDLSVQPLDSSPAGYVIVQTQQLAIVNVLNNNTVVVAGDHTSLTHGDICMIQESSYNDGEWLVLSSEYNQQLDQTAILLSAHSDSTLLQVLAASTVSNDHRMCVSGHCRSYFGIGDTITVSDSVDMQNGRWVVTKMQDKQYELTDNVTDPTSTVALYTELSLEHVTDTAPTGQINTVFAGTLSIAQVINTQQSLPTLVVTPEDPIGYYSTYFDPTKTGAQFLINGNRTQLIQTGQYFTITGSTGNDGHWLANAVGYDIQHDRTTVDATFSSMFVPTTIPLNPRSFAIFGLPLTDASVLVTLRSNWDAVNNPSATSITTADTQIYDQVAFDVAFPTTAANFSITNTIVGDASSTGLFVVTGNQTKYFQPNSQFIIEESGSNNGLWTVHTANWNMSNNTTEIHPVEQIESVVFVPPFITPFGYITHELITFQDRISVDVGENIISSAWDLFYEAAPTTKITSVDSATNSVRINTDMRRFFVVGNDVTIQHSINDIGAWAWTVQNVFYDMATDQTVVYLSGGALQPTHPLGYLSGSPNWLAGFGWDRTGWSDENLDDYPMFTVVTDGVTTTTPFLYEGLTSPE